MKAIQDLEVEALPGDLPLSGQASQTDETGGFQVNFPPGQASDFVDVVSNNNNGNQNQFLALAGGVPEPTQSADGGNLKRVLIGINRSATPTRQGPVAGPFIDVVDRVAVARYEYYVPASPGSADSNASGGDTRVP